MLQGNGSAPLQPQEIMDAAQRIAYLAFADPSTRPIGRRLKSFVSAPTTRFYDAVGPDTVSMLQMLEKFAKYNGNTHFCPVHIDYRNFEKVLNVASLGNLNRQFVSLLRSEQQSSATAVGNPAVWEKLLGPDANLETLDQAFCTTDWRGDPSRRRHFPLLTTLRWAWTHPGVITPGTMLVMETLYGYLYSRLLKKPIPIKER